MASSYGFHRLSSNQIPLAHYDASAALISLCREIQNHGVERSPRGILTKEILNHTTIFPLAEPLLCVIATRGLKPSYVLREFQWYCSLDRSVKFIAEKAKFWNSLADEYGNVVSNYGYWIYGQRSISKRNQFVDVIDTLKADQNSRQAILNIHGLHNRYYNPKDVPCTLSIQFMIVDNQLDMIVNMRSNDLFKGWCNDIIQFQFIAWHVFSQLKMHYQNLKLGNYFHNTGSMHVYESDFEKMNEMAEFHHNSEFPRTKNSVELYKKLLEFSNQLNSGSINVSIHPSDWCSIITQVFKQIDVQTNEQSPSQAIEPELETANILNDEGV